MADYNYKRNTQTSFNADEEKRFRALMDRWANSTKGYKGEKFGESLKIKDVWNTPFYVSTLKYQNDTRTLEYRKEQYKNQIIEPCTIFKESDIDRWKTCDPPQPFSEKEGTYYVKGSKQIKECEACNGVGQTQCPDCEGKGEWECPDCRGKGKEWRTIEEHTKCPRCSGKKKSTYRYYEITGITGEVQKIWHDCEWCNGKGYTVNVKTYKWVCDKCGGKGEVKCEKCNGTGLWICQTCGGNGKMLHSWLVHQKTFVKSNTNFCLPSVFTEEEKKKFIAVFDRTDGTTVFKQCNNGSTFNKSELERQDCTSKGLLYLSDNLVDNAENHITYNEFVTNEYEAKTVTYEVNGKEYRCVLLGNSWDIFSIKSPISDFMDDLKHQVIELAKKDDFGKAWGVMNQVLEFPQAGKKENSVMETIEDEMKDECRFGRNIAMFVLFLAIAPLLKLVTINPDFLPVASWTHFLDGFLHMHHTGDVLVFLALNLFVTTMVGFPKFVYQHEDKVTRILWGAAYGIVCQLLILGLFYVLDWVGIVTLIEWAAYWIVMGAFYVIFFIILAIVLLVELIIGLF